MCEYGDDENSAYWLNESLSLMKEGVFFEFNEGGSLTPEKRVASAPSWGLLLSLVK